MNHPTDPEGHAGYVLGVRCTRSRCARMAIHSARQPICMQSTGERRSVFGVFTA